METALLLEHATQSKFHSNFCILAGQRVKQINCFILGQPVYSSASDDLLEYWFQGFSGKIPSVVFLALLQLHEVLQSLGRRLMALISRFLCSPAARARQHQRFQVQGSHHRGERSSGIFSSAPARSCSRWVLPQPEWDVPGTAPRNTLPFAAQDPAVLCTFLSASTAVRAGF